VGRRKVFIELGKTTQNRAPLRANFPLKIFRLKALGDAKKNASCLLYVISTVHDCEPDSYTQKRGRRCQNEESLQNIERRTENPKDEH